MIRRRIILASASPARKKLLEDLGLKVKVIASQIKESRQLSSGPAALVKANAAKKALAVSKKVKQGIIIAADTVCIADGKLFGKADNFKQALITLRKLSRRPHYVYSGLAVLEKRRTGQKIFLDYEKTKVWMRALTVDEIGKYLRQAKSIKRAGSFDIQGKGALFIQQIHGCFYNVVGLPTAKLYSIFKRLNISLLCLLLSLAFICGCATEYNVATGREDLILIDTQKEINIGRSASDQIERQFKLVQDPIIVSRVNQLGEKIVSVCDRKDISYRFAILNEDSINAVSLPGGFIYVNKGLVDFVKNDDELVAVLAHEVGHVVSKHSIKRLQAAMGLNILTILAAVGGGSSDAAYGTDVAAASLLTAYSREDELLADKLSSRYLRRAGFKPEAIISFLERLKQKKFNSPPGPGGFYLRTHPYTSERIAAIKEETGQELNFKDYINREQNY
jgi:MAF protein